MDKLHREFSINPYIGKKLPFFLNVLICGFFAIIIFLTVEYFYCVSKSNEIHSIKDLNLSYHLDLHFDFSHSKKWHEEGELSIGAQYDCKIKNNGVFDIKEWYCILKVPQDSYVDSFWSGEFELNDGELLIHPLDYNKDILKNDNVTFGFVLHSKYLLENVNFEIFYIKDFNPFRLLHFIILVVIDIVLLVVIVFFLIIFYRFYRFKFLLDQTFDTIVNIIDSFDEYTYTHSKNVGFYSMELAKRMKLKKRDILNIYYVGLVHDIGKISIMRDMLHKQSVFTDDEREIVKKHTVEGGNALKDFTAIPQIKDGALYHHERWDGLGYPKGLKGKEIPLFARIICVADSFDVMASKRDYKDEFLISEIIEELKNCSGTQFDPEIVPYMIQMINEGIAPLHD